jgi:hypothetical protein
MSPPGLVRFSRNTSLSKARRRPVGHLVAPGPDRLQAAPTGDAVAEPGVAERDVLATAPRQRGIEREYCGDGPGRDKADAECGEAPTRRRYGTCPEGVDDGEEPMGGERTPRKIEDERASRRHRAECR